jgi:hypothetical protein
MPHRPSMQVHQSLLFLFIKSQEYLFLPRRQCPCILQGCKQEMAPS